MNIAAFTIGFFLGFIVGFVLYLYAKSLLHTLHPGELYPESE